MCNLKTKKIIKPKNNKSQTIWNIFFFVKFNDTKQIINIIFQYKFFENGH